jgi:Ca2+-binding RTX toxin-like protein
MKKRIAVITAAAMGLALVPATASAQGTNAVVCSFQASVEHRPGVGSMGRAGSFDSSGGTANCAGKVGGETVIGTGDMSIDGSGTRPYLLNGGTGCLVGSGRGSIALEVRSLMPILDPDPSDVLEGNFDYRRSVRAWAAEGSLAGSGVPIAIAGVEEAGDGDCLTKTMNGWTLRGRIVIGGAGAGPDVPVSAACANEVQGTRRSDRLEGTAGTDLVSGFAASDRMNGAAADDCLFGGPGSDRIDGGAGTDTIDCGPGRDVVRADASDHVAPNCEAVRSR